MGINQFKTFALETLCEAHLWKMGESTSFSLIGVDYKIERVPAGWALYSFNKVKKEWNLPRVYPTCGRLFNHIFSDRVISFN